MNKRPKSILIIAWYLIVGGGISLIPAKAMIENPIVRDLMSEGPPLFPAMQYMRYVGFLIMIVSGIAMLKGCNWARFLYVIWNIIWFLVGVITLPPIMMGVMIFGFVAPLIIAFFLFRPKATAFFCQRRKGVL